MLNKKMLFHFGIYTSLLLLIGCAVKNEGAIDIRKTNNSHAVKEGLTTSLSLKNISLGKDAGIDKDDRVSVYLKTVYIKDFSEFTRKANDKKQGEIAIVADVKEFDKTINIDFLAKKEGRLIFYSDDVENGQFLNLNNAPIYGPKIYNGNPFLLKFSIMELDVSQNSTKNVLGQLADMGAQAYAPASPILKVLNGLGQSFLGGKGDDTLFKYLAVMNDNKGSHLVEHFTLEVGNYVLIRKEKRDEPINWGNIVLNPNDGKLYFKNGNLYNDETYIVFEINKGVSGLDIDLENISYEAFLNELQQQNVFNETDVNASVKLFKSAIKDRENLTVYYELIDNIEELKNDNIDKFEREDVLEEVIESIGKNVDENGTLVEQSNISKKQLDSLILKLKRLRKDSDTYNLFSKENFYKILQDGNTTLLDKFKKQIVE